MEDSTGTCPQCNEEYFVGHNEIKKSILKCEDHHFQRSKKEDHDREGRRLAEINALSLPTKDFIRLDKVPALHMLGMLYDVCNGRKYSSVEDLFLDYEKRVRITTDSTPSDENRFID